MKNLSCFSIVFIAIFLCVCERTWSANILYMSTTASPSHVIWDKTLAIALKDKGHHVTFVSFQNLKSADNFTAIYLEGIFEAFAADTEFNLESFVNYTTIENIHLMYSWFYLTCDFGYKTQGMKTLLNLIKEGTKFDMIIFDMTTGICYYPLVELLNHPLLVGTCPFGVPPYLSPAFGIDLQIAYVPYTGIMYTPNMTFVQRFVNYFIQIYEMIMRNHYWGKYKELLDDVYGKDTKHIFEAEKNFSIFLPNYDPILDYARPLPPDVIPVGGLHTKRANTLSQDMQKYLDNSKNGVIMFSLGTNIRSDQLSESKKKIILDTFAQLKQNVIWKFESEIADLPKNVIVKKFLPQNDILAHPNLKLLINHGGSLSTQEAMYNGVPLVTIPFFLDQYVSSYKIVTRQIGQKINYINLTVDYFLSTIRDVIENPIYKENVQKLSRKFRDRADHPLDRAVFWVEHVLRQGGAEQLRIPARHMPFYQVQLLDIWLVIIIVIITVVLIIKKILKSGRKVKVD